MQYGSNVENHEVLSVGIVPAISRSDGRWGLRELERRGRGQSIVEHNDVMLQKQLVVQLSALPSSQQETRCFWGSSRRGEEREGFIAVLGSTKDSHTQETLGEHEVSWLELPTLAAWSWPGLFCRFYLAVAAAENTNVELR
jgi:hypothetical protein